MSIGYGMLSKQSLDILIDLVEIKLSAIIVHDKDDIREVRRLKHCKSELLMSRKIYTKNIDDALSDKKILPIAHT
ncbi:hypothetical protein FACS1894126_0510 [Alphaproteobacteria bacterium]|nr:hypothetical protein FACS1894126_0510 [Alphaproteobacteria bacterium]